MEDYTTERVKPPPTSPILHYTDLKIDLKIYEINPFFLIEKDDQLNDHLTRNRRRFQLNEKQE